MSLPTIPFATERTSTQQIIEDFPEHFEGMITACFDAAEELGAAGAFAMTDFFSNWSLGKNAERWAPYRGELDFVMDKIGEMRGTKRGAATILLTDEWGCSTRSMQMEDGSIRMQRLLDIPPHVGHLPIVTQKDVASGTCLTATYPGLVGEAHGMTREFAIAQHVAPTPKTIFGRTFGARAIPADYLVNAVRNTVTNEGYSATLLIRKTLEEASTADEALDMLASEPTTGPVLYHLATPDRAYIIERMPRDAVVHEGTNLCGTNTWLNDRFPEAWSKPHAPIAVQPDETGEARLEIIQQTMQSGDGMEPSYKPLTRLRLDMNPAQGTFRAVGMEHDQPATQVFEHQFG